MTPLTRTTGPQLTLSHPVVWPLPNLYSRCSTFIVGKKFSSLPLLAMVKLSCCPLCSSSKNTRWQLKLDKKKQMLMKGTSFFPFNSYLSNQGVLTLFSRGFEMLTKIFNSVHGWLTILCSRSPKSDIMTVRRRHCPLFSIHGLPKSASIHVKQLRNNKDKAQKQNISCF